MEFDVQIVVDDVFVVVFEVDIQRVGLVVASLRCWVGRTAIFVSCDDWWKFGNDAGLRVLV